MYSLIYLQALTAHLCSRQAGARCWKHETEKQFPALEAFKVWLVGVTEGRHSDNQGGDTRLVVHTRGSKDPRQVITIPPETIFRDNREQLKQTISV